jgi:hypothetical protein
LELLICEGFVGKNTVFGENVRQWQVKPSAMGRESWPIMAAGTLETVLCQHHEAPLLAAHGAVGVPISKDFRP